MTPLVLRPVRRISDIRASNHRKEKENLEKEPRPAALSLLTCTMLAILPQPAAARLPRLWRPCRRRIIQVLRSDADDVVVIRQLTRFRREAQIRHGRNHRRVLLLKAQNPLILCLVLQLQLQDLILEVGQSCLRRHARTSDAPRAAASILVRLAVVHLVVWSLSIPKRGHDVGEHGARTVVFVGIDEDAEAFVLVYGAKNRTRSRALAGKPHRHAIPVEIALAVDVELDFDLRWSAKVVWK